MKTALAASEGKGGICPAQHDSGLLCWARKRHDGPHMAVLPNVDKAVCTRPQVVRW